MEAVKLLLILISIAFLLRVFNIQSNPPSMSGDELTLAYDTYSVLKTGHTQTGQFLPLTLELGESRPAAYLYFSLPFVALFGPTEFGIRILSVIVGTVMIYLIYLLGKKLFNEKNGIVAAFFMVITPWAINLSRNNIDINLGLFFSLLGVVLFLYGKTKHFFLPLSALSFLLGMHAYQTAKLTSPIIILILVLYFGKKFILDKKLRKWFIFSGLIVALSFGLIIQQSLTTNSEGRFFKNNIFTNNTLRQKVLQKVNFERTISNAPIISLPFHNKYLEYTSLFTYSTFDHFSDSFLIWKGDANPRHNMGETGMLFLIQTVLVLVGFISLLKQKRILLLLFSLLLLGAISSSLLGETHAPRSSLMLIPLILFCAVGLPVVLKQKQFSRKFLRIVLVIVLVGQFVLYTEKIYFVSGNKFSQFWAYPAKLAAQTAINKGVDFEYVILSNKIDNMEYAYRTYGRVDPNSFINKNIETKLLGYDFKQYKATYIGLIPESDIEDFMQRMDKSTLLIISKDEFIQLADKNRSFALTFKEIKGLDQDTAFAVLEKY